MVNHRWLQLHCEAPFAIREEHVPELNTEEVVLTSLILSFIFFLFLQGVPGIINAGDEHK